MRTEENSAPDPGKQGSVVWERNSMENFRNDWPLWFFRAVV